MSISNNSYVCAVLAAVLMPVMGVAAWVPTADSTTSSPKFTDGNFVISWNANNKQLKYESHNSSVSTVCDMSTLSEDIDAVAGYSHPTQVAGSGFASKSGITRVILPEACYGINQQSFSNMAELESVVISSQTRIAGKQAFSSNKNLSMVTPHGLAETNGVVFLPETVTAIPANCFQNQSSAANLAIKHVIAPGATDFGGDACFQYCKGLETVTVKDLKHIYTLTFQSCNALTKVVVLSRENPFSGIESISGSEQFRSCSSWTQPFDFSASTFTSLASQMFYGADKVPEYRFPATLASFAKQALRSDGCTIQRRIWFYGPPPSFYYSSSDADYCLWGPSGVRQVVFVPESYAVAWTNALSQDGATFSAISATDRARADYPTKLEDVMVKVRGSRYDLVPSRVKDSDVLGVTNGRSRWNNAGRPYYVVQWREAEPGMAILVR